MGWNRFLMGLKDFFGELLRCLWLRMKKIKQKNIDKKQKSNRALFIRMLY